MKTCTTCEIEKDLEEFYKNKEKKGGLEHSCKNCKKEYQKKYQIKNKERIKKYGKEYWKNNKAKLLEQQKEYNEKNREKLNLQKIKYYKERIKNDPIFRLQKNLRSRTSQAIKKGYKCDSTQELLGCTWNQVRIHLENQFLEGMTWENYGEWEIDHIRPMASFDLTDLEQQRLCCNYSNLRPMWKEENRSKSSMFNGIMH